MRILPIILTLIALLSLGTLRAQNASQAQITAQKEAIEKLEAQIAAQEQEISAIKKGRSSAEERARKLARQIETRNDLLSESQKEEQQLLREVEQTDASATRLHAELLRHKERYGAMVREAYRNYRHNNYLTYLFSAESFGDMARRIANLREVAALRERQILTIDSLERATEEQRRLLNKRQEALDSVRKSLSAQKRRLQADAAEAKASIRQLNKKEQEALKKKVLQEQQLDAAVAELRKLVKGNKQGASFSSKTRNLRLPVEGGSVKRYHGNMAEITGRQGAAIRSIYEGKVVDVKRNRITNKYDLFIAHGEYITSYGNLSAVCVEKGAAVGRNQKIGTIGSSVDVLTMQNEYKLVFGIYPPNPKQQIKAADCFKK